MVIENADDLSGGSLVVKGYIKHFGVPWASLFLRETIPPVEGQTRMASYRAYLSSNRSTFQQIVDADKSVVLITVIGMNSLGDQLVGVKNITPTAHQEELGF